MLVEAYYPLLNRDIQTLTEYLENENLPEPIRQGIEAELLKLQDLYKTLSAEDSTDKRLLNLRGRLRWARQRHSSAKDPQSRKKAQDEVTQLETAIAGLVTQQSKSKK